MPIPGSAALVSRLHRPALHITELLLPSDSENCSFYPENWIYGIQKKCFCSLDFKGLGVFFGGNIYHTEFYILFFLMCHHLYNY